MKGPQLLCWSVCMDGARSYRYRRIKVSGDMQFDLDFGGPGGEIVVRLPEQKLSESRYWDTKTSTMACTLLDRKGDPVENCGQFQAVHDGDIVSFYGLEDGHYKVHIEGRGIEPEDVSVKLKHGEKVDVTPKLKPSCRVTVTLTTYVNRLLPLLESVQVESHGKPIELEAPLTQPQWKRCPVVVARELGTLVLYNVPRSAKEVRIKLRGLEDMVLRLKLKPGDNRIDALYESKLKQS